MFRDLAIFIGAILVTISATPLPNWFYGVLGVTTFAWLVSEWLTPKSGRRFVKAFRLAVFLLWSTATGMECPHYLVPSLPVAGGPVLFVIGDSVTAGLGERKEATWPAMLARDRGLTVHDFSHVGATVLSAARNQANRIGDRDGLVLLEIGGNDLLGTTSASDFRKGLDQLLASVCIPGRTVVMFELPLPPFRNDFGRIQRQLARQYDVKLIPKRIFLSVLMTPGATLDGIHLSPTEHKLMRDVVWGLLEEAYARVARVD